MKKRILILTASVGSGHIKAAEAVAEELMRQEPELELVTVDFMSRETSCRASTFPPFWRNVLFRC